LQYFKGKELLEIRQISSHWKSYIESSDFLMNRAMDHVVVRFYTSRQSKDYAEQVMRSNIKAKHMKIDFLQYQTPKSLRLHPLIEHFAICLETLVIVEGISRFHNENIALKSIQFPLLKKLIIQCKSREIEEALQNFIILSEFPELTDFVLSTLYFEGPNMKKILQNLPKLISFSTYNIVHIEADENDASLPKIESLKLNGASESFLRAFKYTLVELKISSLICKPNIRFIIENLPMLKRLSIVFVGVEKPRWFRGGNHAHGPYLQHYTLEELTVDCGIFGSDEELHRLIWAFPFLKVLTYEGLIVSKDTIRFLGEEIFF
jgi:hypothetical protein